MKVRKFGYLWLLLAWLWVLVAFTYGGCAPPKPEPVRIKPIKDSGYEPSNWGKVYSLEYEPWLQTKKPRAVGESKYKKGWDTDNVVYDKLSEFS